MMSASPDPYKSREQEEASRQGLSAVKESPTNHPQLPPQNKQKIYSTVNLWFNTRLIKHKFANLQFEKPLLHYEWLNTRQDIYRA